MASVDDSSGATSATTDTTQEFLRSFSVVDRVSDDDSDFDELSPIPETPGDILDDEEADFHDSGEIDGEGEDGPRILPYMHRFRPPKALSSQLDNCWIPGQIIHITVEAYERHAALKMLNPNLYTIRIKHGDYQWEVRRRYKHFRQLHDALALFRARYRLPLPTKEHVQRRRTILRDLRGMKKERKQKKQKSVRLPLRPDYMLSEEDIPTRMKQLEKYLQNLMTCKSYRNHPESLKFFEVSPLSFVHKLGIKSREGAVEKCSGGRRINIQCCGCLQNLHVFGNWRRRWLIVKDNFVAYIRPEDGQLSDVMLMDSEFKVDSGLLDTGAKHGVLIENKSRKLLVKCWTGRKAREWEETIRQVAQTHATDYTSQNRFDSFAPPREKEFARWFVDGRTYFEAVADALEKAKEEIYITDWWLSPEIYLKRPIVDGDKWRLDVILKRKAEQGVKVFILLYKEIELSLTIKSIYSKQTLMSQCPENIKVLRHPDHIPGAGVLLWAHHEKLVIIDQQVAFAGGLDLCYGRWDDEMHRLTDLGSDHLKPKTEVNASVSDVNAEISSHTEVSVMTSQDNLSASSSMPAVVISPPEAANKTPMRQSGVMSMPSPVVEESKAPSPPPQEESLEDLTDGQTSVLDNVKTPSPSSEYEVDTQFSTHDNPQNDSTQVPNSTDTNAASIQHESETADVEPSVDNSKLCDVSNSSVEGTSRPASPAQVMLSDTVGVLSEDRDDTAPVSSVSPHDSDSDDTAPNTPRSSQPVEANVVVQSTHPISDTAHRDNLQHSDAQGREHSTAETPRTVGSPAATPRKAPRRPKLLRQQSSIVVDTHGFSDSALEEITKSMQPFKDIHGDCAHNRDSDKRQADVIPHVGEVNAGYHDTSLDKEIVCSAHATDISEDNIDSASTPKLRRKEGDGSNASERSNLKGSHLWKRRSKHKSLELIIPKKESEGAKYNGGSENGIIEVENEEKLRTNSDSSEASRHSNTDLLADKQAGAKVKKSPKDPKSSREPTPPSSSHSHGGLSLAGAVGAMNALKKILYKKEENNNKDDNKESETTTSENDPSTTARRRWKMILNVSKFETIIRTPQVPERIDESVFYNQNVQFPSSSKTKMKLVQSFKEGIDKLKKHERRGSDELPEAVDKACRHQLLHTHSEEDILERGLLGSTKLWIGKDYVNFIYKDFVNLEQPFEDFIDRQKTHRMPWHDIGCVVYGKGARDLARHFIGRWNFTKLEKCKTNPNFPLLLPKTTSKVYIPRVIRDITFEVKQQVLRSTGGWSGGISSTDNSIHQAYEHCIENSRDYIYIENQFFITQTGNQSSVSNVVGNALYKRILRAHRSNRPFKVYVVMPLLPAFEGEFGTNTGAALQAVTHWNLSSICRGGNSLMERLAQVIPDPNQYIVFCGLRTWDKLNEKLCTELIYVHSKLMIVDDDTVIIGSANINDRSLLGPRDSEIAILFEDIHKVDVTVNNKQYQAGRFASSLRWTIFREHLGLLHEADFVDLSDITSDSFYKDVWIKRAAVNTTCYDKVFHCLPTDNVTNFTELRQYQSVPPMAYTNPEEAMKWLGKVRGYLVLIPLQFLREENLTPKVGQKEALLPTYLWT